MTMNYRGIKHDIVSTKKQTKPGTVKETYRGIALFNRVVKG
ncbi:MAG: hypothetical protein AB4042_20365 [Leptolyngbyaceae cyanobacterium]